MLCKDSVVSCRRSAYRSPCRCSRQGQQSTVIGLNTCYLLHFKRLWKKSNKSILVGFDFFASTNVKCFVCLRFHGCNPFIKRWCQSASHQTKRVWTFCLDILRTKSGTHFVYKMKVWLENFLHKSFQHNMLYAQGFFDIYLLSQRKL